MLLTLTIAYTGCTKDHIVYAESGEVTSQETEYEDGTGTITKWTAALPGMRTSPRPARTWNLSGPLSRKQRNKKENGMN